MMEDSKDFVLVRNLEDSKEFSLQKAADVINSRISLYCGTGRRRGRPPKMKPQPIRQRAFYFSIKPDIRLLHYVLQLNPFDNQKSWQEIVNNMNSEGFMCNFRQCKDRVNFLMSVFERQKLDHINKSGTDEEWNERTQLISEVISCKEASIGISVRESMPTPTRGDTPNASDVFISPETCEDAHRQRDDVGYIMDEESDHSQMSIAHKIMKMEDPTENVFLSKALMEHEIELAKIKVSEEDKKRLWELEQQKIQLEERRLMLEEETHRRNASIEERKLDMEENERKRMAALEEMRLRHQEQANARQAENHAQFMAMSKQLIDMMNAFINRAAKKDEKTI